MLLSRIFWVMLACTVSACTTMNLAPVAEAPATRAQAFRLEARLSVRQAQKVDSANLVWVKSAAAQTINITGPLGVQVAKISQSPGEAAMLSRGDTAPIERAETVDALVTQALGVTIRVERIIEWVQLIGLPTNGDVVTLKIDGTDWQVSAETTQQLRGQTIAQRLVARSGDITIKLFIDDWQNLDSALK
jgi:outer membrane biogenesis lipoprotein LolB